MGLRGYTAEVTNLCPYATEKDVYAFFSFCGSIEHVEVLRSQGCAYSAYVTFSDPHALQTSVLLSGATIGDRCVCIRSYSHYEDDLDYWKAQHGSRTMYTMHADPFVSSPGEAVTMAQEVVKTMVAKGYVLSKDAYSKAKAFDESYQVSAKAGAKVLELSKRVGLTNKINAGVENIKYVDEYYHVSDTTKFIARTATAAATAASTAATAVVNSTLFAKGALLVSDALFKAAKVAADLGSHGN